MGTFERAIPKYVLDEKRQVVEAKKEPYVDDIYDPLFNRSVKEYLDAKYGNALFGTIGGYGEGLKNAILGQDGKWGILGSGMGILSQFGRSMDKSGDFLLGGITEGFKGITGQGIENPIENIFVEDEDYSGKGLITAMANSMNKLAGKPTIQENDLSGFWNIPGLAIDLATDPGLLGMGLSKKLSSSPLRGVKSLDILKNLGKNGAKSAVGEVGQLLSNYDDLMAKVAIDITAPGLRPGAKALKHKISQILGNYSAKDYVNVDFDEKDISSPPPKRVYDSPEASVTEGYKYTSPEATVENRALYQAPEGKFEPDQEFVLRNVIQNIVDKDFSLASVKQAKKIIQNNPVIDSLMDMYDNISKVPNAKVKDEKFLEVVDSIYRLDVHSLEKTYAKNEAKLPKTYASLTEAVKKRDISESKALDNFFKTDVGKRIEMSASSKIKNTEEAVKSKLNELLTDFERDKHYIGKPFKEYIRDKIIQENPNLEGFNPTYFDEFFKDFNVDKIIKEQYTTNEATNGAFSKFFEGDSRTDLDQFKINVKKEDATLTISPTDFGKETSKLKENAVAHSINTVKKFLVKENVIKNIPQFEDYKDFRNWYSNTKELDSVFLTDFDKKQFFSKFEKVLFPSYVKKEAKNKIATNSLDDYLKNVEEFVKEVRDKLSFKDESIPIELSDVLDELGEDFFQRPERYLPKKAVSSYLKNSKIVDPSAYAKYGIVDSLDLSDADYSRFINTLKRSVSIKGKKSFFDDIYNLAESLERDVINPTNKMLSYENSFIKNDFSELEKVKPNIYEGTGYSTHQHINKMILENPEAIKSLDDIKAIYDSLGDTFQVKMKNFKGDIAGTNADRIYNHFTAKVLPDLKKLIADGKSPFTKNSAFYKKYIENNLENKWVIERVLENKSFNNNFGAIQAFTKGFEVKTFEELDKILEVPQVAKDFSKFSPKAYGSFLQLQKAVREMRGVMHLLSVKTGSETKGMFNELIKLIKTTPYEELPKMSINLSKPSYNFFRKFDLDKGFDITKNIYLGEINEDILANGGLKLKNALLTKYDFPQAFSESPVIAKESFPGAILRKYNTKGELLTKYDKPLAEEIKNSIESLPSKEFSEQLANPKSLVENKIEDFKADIFDTDTEILQKVSRNSDEIRKMPAGSPMPDPEDGDEIYDSVREIFNPRLVNLNQLIDKASAVKHNVKDKSKLITFDKANVNDFVDYLEKEAPKHFTSKNIKQYMAIQDYLKGDMVVGDNLLAEITSAGGALLGKIKNQPKHITDALVDTIRKNVSEVNNAVGAELLVPIRRTLKDGSEQIGISFNAKNTESIKNIAKHKKKLSELKLADLVFDAPGDLSKVKKEVLESMEYNNLDNIFNKIRGLEKSQAKVLGFDYSNDPYHIKHAFAKDVNTADYIKNNLYDGIPIEDLEDLSSRIMESGLFKEQTRGVFGTKNYSKRLRGNIAYYNDNDAFNVFTTNLSEIAKSSLADGIFEDSNFKTFTELFVNENFKLKNNFKDLDSLKKVLYVKDSAGNMSGNLDNLIVSEPIYNSRGRLTGFKRYNSLNDKDLSEALSSETATILPLNAFTPLDKILRKDAKMSNEVLSFINKYITIPFKFGVLVNPGFLFGNASDAWLKQATTMSQKFGTTVPKELAQVKKSLIDVMNLNNNFDLAFRKYVADLELKGIKLSPTDKISDFIVKDGNAKKRLLDYFNLALKDKSGKIIDVALTGDEIMDIRTWMFLNSSQSSSMFEGNLQDLEDFSKAFNSSKYDMPTNIFERISTGKGKYDKNDLGTWGLFVNNPVSKKVMNMSESIENHFRMSSMLNDLKHKGFDINRIKEHIQGIEGFNEFDGTNKITIEMNNAINTMFNSNFDYQNVTPLLDKASDFIPFPTFFLKNLGYWLELFVENPKYVQTAIRIQEGMWKGRNTEEDDFPAQAKGRGAIPLPDSLQKVSKGLKGFIKPTPLNSMFGAFNTLNDPIKDLAFRINPLYTGALQAASTKVPALSLTTNALQKPEDTKYRPYNTNVFEKNIDKNNPEFNGLEYLFHRMNPYDRAIQSGLRLPNKMQSNNTQLSDFLPSVFQPDFSKK